MGPNPKRTLPLGGGEAFNLSDGNSLLTLLLRSRFPGRVGASATARCTTHLDFIPYVVQALNTKQLLLVAAKRENGLVLYNEATERAVELAPPARELATSPNASLAELVPLGR